MEACAVPDVSACPVEVPSTPGPRNLWELEVTLRCPVVGQCLSEPERLQLLKRFGVSTKRLSPFEIHEIFVACGENENRLSRRVQGLLERKYGDLAAELHALDEEGALRRWEEAFAVGDVGGPFWALATHPGLSEEGRRRIFGDVHMAMHETADRVVRWRREREELRSVRDDLVRRLRESEEARREVLRREEALRRDREDLLARLERAERAREDLWRERETSDREDRVLRLEEECRRLKVRSEVAEERCALRERQGEEMKLRLAVLEREKESRDRFLGETGRILEDLHGEECAPTCPVFDLCRKRVLIVGGIARMETLYRKLVEENGGIFDYHDGAVQGGARQLEERLKRADVVLCPVTCNSHAACRLVKDLGKKYRKPVRMLDNHSVARLARGLEV